MSLKYTIVVLQSVFSTCISVDAQELRCAAWETEKDSVIAEENRIKTVFTAAIGKPEIPEEVCRNLNDKMQLNNRVAKIFRQCADVGFPKLRDLAIQYEQENRQVYQPTAMQYGCQRFIR